MNNDIKGIKNVKPKSEALMNKPGSFITQDSLQNSFVKSMQNRGLAYRQNDVNSSRTETNYDYDTSFLEQIYLRDRSGKVLKDMYGPDLNDEDFLEIYGNVKELHSKIQLLGMQKRYLMNLDETVERVNNYCLHSIRNKSDLKSQAFKSDYKNIEKKKTVLDCGVEYETLAKEDRFIYNVPECSQKSNGDYDFLWNKKISLNTLSIKSPIKGSFSRFSADTSRFGETFTKGGYSLTYMEPGWEGANLSNSYAFFMNPEIIDNESLLKKTNKLFQENAIDTMLNRFHDKDGMSKGRNLRMANNKSENSTGFDNPYCRVWTKLRQYGKFEDAIRNGTYEDIPYYRDTDAYDNKRTKDAVYNLSKWTPLMKNGRVRVAPSIDSDITRCMFSIENLAWKDSPLLDSGLGYMKGPNRGRIEWFPPYNLKFNEQITANWNSNKFIGRGEDIYTYTNTERNGTLSFTLLIDHPSCLNEWNIESKGTEEEEQNILRFFAGCGGIDADPVVSGEDKELHPQIEKEPVKTDPPEVFRTLIFFPHHFSGKDFRESNIEGMDYLVYGSNFGISYGSVGNNEKKGYELSNSALSNTEPSVVEPVRGWKYYVEKYINDDEPEIKKKEDLNSFNLNEDKSCKDIYDTHAVIGGIDHKYFFTFKELYDLIKNKGINHQDGNTSINRFYKAIKEAMKCEIEISSIVPEIGNKEYLEMDNEERIKTVESWLKKQNSDVKTEYSSSSYIVSSESIIDKKEYDADSKEIKCLNFVDLTFKVYKSNIITTSLNKGDGEIGNTHSSYRSISRWMGNGTYSDEMLDKNPFKDGINNFKERVEEGIGKARIFAKYGKMNSKTIEPNEYYYFRDLKANDKTLYERIDEKIKYFNPAFHSVTPEGFNERLTFLHQCTRQGPTNSAPESHKDNPQGYGNLAFGRPPYCILRIGDFFNTKIVIDSISIDYADNQWDMNPEGIGIQPMMANVSINFKFTGGTDISGPVEELQNAVSFNYYSNASVYDNTARGTGEFKRYNTIKGEQEIPDTGYIKYLDGKETSK